MCALKQLISPVNMFFYSDVRIWLEDAAIATASFLCLYYPVLRLGGLLGIECFDADVAGGKIGIFYCLYVAARQKFFPRTAVAVYK